MSDDIEMHITNADNMDISKIYNSSHGELTQVIHYFDKMNIKEIEPTIQNINESIYEEDLSIVVDEWINITFKHLNQGKEKKSKKKDILDYINNHKIILQEIYNWLLNNQNDSNSIYLFGYFKYRGIGTNTDKKKALELYQKAASLENIVAQLELANMYIHEKWIENNYIKSFELSKKLAEKDNPSAVNRLGYCYDYGIGTNINQQKAFELYQKAADLGNLNGINNLGRCYSQGIGIGINRQKAFELYQKAADLGNRFAQYNLALIYEYGNGVEINVEQAVYWYKKSAEQGHANAKKIKNTYKQMITSGGYKQI